MAEESPVTQDPDAAREFREAYGFSGNAEQIIRANQQRVTPELRRAQQLGVNDEATKELERGDAASQLGVEEDQLEAFAVRGGFLVGVYNDESGAQVKRAVPMEGTDFKLSPEEQASRTTSAAEAKVLAAQREARADVEKAVEEARVKAEEEAAEKLQSASEEAAEEQQKAAEEGEKAREEGETGQAGSTADESQAQVEAATSGTPSRRRRSGGGSSPPESS